MHNVYWKVIKSSRGVTIVIGDLNRPAVRIKLTQDEFRQMIADIHDRLYGDEELIEEVKGRARP